MGATPLVWGARFIVGKGLTYWATHGGLSAFDSSIDAESVEGRKLVMVFTQKQDLSISTRDTQMVTSHWLSATSWLDGESWDDDAYTLIETAVKAWMTANAGYFPQTIGLDELRWYAAGPAWAPVGDPPHSPPSPVLRATTFASIRGSGGEHGLPPQVCCNLTFRTPSRKHWGRSCMPGLQSQYLSESGRYSATATDALANSWHDMAATLAAGGLIQTVYSPTSLAFLGITAIECDTTPDVQRRRRWATTRHKLVLPTA